MPGKKNANLRVAIITLSTRVAKGERKDLGGDAVANSVQKSGMSICDRKVIADKKQELTDYLSEVCRLQKADIILTTGGTGLSKSDVTPEATIQIIEKRLAGLEFAMFQFGLKQTPYAALSRAIAGTCKNTVIVNLPGNPRGATENLSAIIDVLPHAVKVLQSEQVADKEHTPPTSSAS